MKKFLIILGLMLASSTQAFAVCDYSIMCAPQPYDLASRGSQVACNVTGMTFLSEQFAQALIKSELKKATKEKFKVEMKSFSAADLAHGRFQSLKISGKNLDIDGVYLSSFNAQTACDFNYVDFNQKPLKFKENMVMNFSMEMSNTDLANTVKSSGYLQMLNKVNLTAYGITFFRLEGADVQIKNDKLYFTIKVTTPLSSKQIPVVVRSDVKVQDGQIVLTKVDLVNMYSALDLSRAAALLNVLDPLTFSTDILHNKNTKVSVQDVDIVGDRILVKGQLFIPKNTK